MNTFQCYVSSDSRDQHGAAVTSVGCHVTITGDGHMTCWLGSLLL